MKFLNKHKRIIGFILTVTVSVMLFVSSIPASASTATLRYGSTFPMSGSLDAWANSALVEGNTHWFGGSGCIAFSNSSVSGFHMIHRTASYNSDCSFSFSCPKAWRPAFANGTMKGFVVVEAMDGTITALRLGAFSTYVIESNQIKDYSPLENGNAIFKFTFTSSSQAKFMDSIGWGQAYIIAVGIRNEAGNTGYFSCPTVNYNSLSGNNAVSSGDSNHWYSGLTTFFVGIFEDIKSFFANLFDVHTYEFLVNFTLIKKGVDSVVDKLQDLYNSNSENSKGLLNGVFNMLKDFFDEKSLLYAVFDGMADSMANINEFKIDILGQKLDRLFSNITFVVDTFTPYFNRTFDMISDNFLHLVQTLNPIVNDFVTAIAPSFESIVNNISSNISKIIKECFIPDNASAEYQEFVSMKDDVTNKFPIFSQLYSFVSVLFNPTQYTPGSTVQYSNLIKNFEPIYFTNAFNGTRYNYNFSSKQSYMLTFNAHKNTSNASVTFFDSSGMNCKQVKISNGFNTINLKFDTSVTSFYFYYSESTDYFSVDDICLYSVGSSLGQDFTVNLYGQKISVLSFDWYMPYKHYGDILVISFCYLAFVWRTFKRLPQII